MEDCRQLMYEGCAALKLDLSEEKIGQLLKFIGLIEKWNKAYNLTAIKNKPDMVSLHLLDSLTVLPFLYGDRIIDIGTGAGLPGIPLAICRPDFNFTLLDSNAKKTRFVQQAALELSLPNVQVIHSRVEDFQPEVRFDTVLTRAFADLMDIITLVHHLAVVDGKLIAMKAKCSEQEFGKVTLPKDIIPVKIPGVSAERNLVCISL